MCVPGYPTCVCIRGWRPVCVCEMSKCGNGRSPHVLDGVGHNRDGDEVEYDDVDEESCPLCLHNPTHTQGEGGDVFV